MAKKLEWYKEGLRFSCTGCGKCCTGFPGYVWLTPTDIQRLAQHLKRTESAFLQEYTRTIGGRVSLKEHPTTYDCVFLKDKLCTVYEARPAQCRTFPFWKHNLSSKKAWRETARFCEGINHQEARLIPLSEIKQTLTNESTE